MVLGRELSELLHCQFFRQGMAEKDLDNLGGRTLFLRCSSHVVGVGRVGGSQGVFFDRSSP